MASSSLLVRGFKAKAERMSEEFRVELGKTKFDALDAFSLAQHLKIQISSVKEIFEDANDNKHYEILSDCTKFNAMWMPNIHGDKIIIHNDNHSLYRQQSNLMHELSHIILGHEIPLKAAQLCHEFNLHYYNPVHEEEAKYLGGCLQITREGLLAALKSKKSKEQISNLFSASLEMVNYRINTTGVEVQLRWWK